MPGVFFLEVMKMLKLLSLFSGIGAFEKALTNIDELFEVVNYCEIDKYASKAYSLIHNIPESKNLHDVTTIDTSKLPTDIDILTYGFPCQDISTPGKQRGLVDENGNRTRSGLFFEALRIIQDVKPKIAIAENVKALTGKKFKLQYSIVLNSLINAGLLRIRRFTPKECFRLMGFNDADVDILSKNGISNTQLYKMAGNSIVVDVLEELFVELLNQYEDVFPVGG